MEEEDEDEEAIIQKRRKAREELLKVSSFELLHDSERKLKSKLYYSYLIILSFSVLEEFTKRSRICR